MPPPTNNQAATTDLGTAYNSFASVYEPQVQAARDAEAQAYSTRDTTINQLKQDQTKNLSSLDQAKANAFTNNALTSNARGIMYSGYTPATNQAYTVNTYNPNVDRVNTNFQRGSDAASIKAGDTVKSLEAKIAELNQQRSNDAQTLVLNTQQAQQQAAKESAAAAKAAAKAGQPSQNQIAAAITQGLAKASGRDGYVSPEDYAQAYADWINAGYSASSFGSTFKNFRNPNNNYYNYAVTQAIKRS
jgi:hypothetical protein